jgi:plastocyanin
MSRIGLFLAAMALVATFVTACGGSNNSGYNTAATTTGMPTENTPAAATGPTLTIADMAFGQPLTVAPGAQINVVNKDSVEHSVTSNAAGTFDVDVDGGKAKTLTAPTQPGEYPFHCSYHPSMKGTLTVK